MEDTRKLFENYDTNELLDFLAEAIRFDDELRERFRIRFEELDYKNDLKRAKSSLASIYREAEKQWRKFYDKCAYVDTNALSAEVSKRAEQGHIEYAFKVAEMLYTAATDHLSFQVDDEMSLEAHSCVHRMTYIAERATRPEDKAYIFSRCLELSYDDSGRSYYEAFDLDLLGACAFLATPENRAQLEQTLDTLETEKARKGMAPIRYQVMRKFDPPEVVRDFVKQNLHDPELCKVALSDAMAAKDYDLAEILCNHNLVSDAGRYDKDKLIHLHTISVSRNDNAKLAEISKRLMLMGYNYFESLKSALQALGTWEKTRPSILKQFSSAQYFPEILIAEGEWAMLLEKVKANPNSFLYIHGKALAKHYRDDVLNLYRQSVTDEAEHSSKEREYSFACKCLSQFAESGYPEEAAELRDQLLAKYKAKRTFTKLLKELKF
ncbi:MAG: hypothetical protein LBT59_06455 [Clostridiales bacterium]|jgi:hypothetical protein|nr:hypothetical protein [Clostridiales bacterium]